MKLKKAALAVACAGVLVVGSVTATMAYLTSDDSVVNTFTVGNVAIAMDETNVDEKDADGNANPNEPRDKANKYHLLPGESYVKDPVVYVGSESEDCWLFVKVVNQIEGIEAAGQGTVENQMIAFGWELIDAENGIYAYNTFGKAADKIPVFETFTVAGGVDNEELAEYANSSICVQACAVQKAGFATAASALDVAKDLFTI